MESNIRSKDSSYDLILHYGYTCSCVGKIRVNFVLPHRNFVPL